MPAEGKFVDTQCKLINGVFRCVHCNGIVIPKRDYKFEHEDNYRYPCSCPGAHQATKTNQSTS